METVQSYRFCRQLLETGSEVKAKLQYHSTTANCLLAAAFATMSFALYINLKHAARAAHSWAYKALEIGTGRTSHLAI